LGSVWIDEKEVVISLKTFLMQTEIILEEFRELGKRSGLVTPEFSIGGRMVVLRDHARRWLKRAMH
jgi:hypothetical protein